MAGLIEAALKYGGLGLIALIAVIALGYNTQQLNQLLTTGTPAAIRAATPLLRLNIVVSAIGMVLFLAAGLYLTSGERRARVDIDPRTTSDEFKDLKLVKIDGKPITSHPIMVDCHNGQATEIEVDFRQFLNRQRQRELEQAENAIKFRRAAATLDEAARDVAGISAGGLEIDR